MHNVRGPIPIFCAAIIAPANQYALIGQSANLSCYNAQKGTAQINWYSREDPSVNGSSSVSIRAVSLDDDHAFICSVVQSMTTVMRTVYLHIIGEQGKTMGVGIAIRGGIRFASEDIYT